MSGMIHVYVLIHGVERLVEGFFLLDSLVGFIQCVVNIGEKIWGQYYRVRFHVQNLLKSSSGC